jgi:hypothetical protein
MSSKTLINEVMVDTLIALSMWMSYDEALEMISGLESQEEYEQCAGMMRALELHSQGSPNCRISNIYFKDDKIRQENAEGNQSD